MSMSFKKYNPIKIKNPTISKNGYTVYVNPRQSIVLYLNKNNYEELSLNSDFLIIETICKEPDKIIYNISQKYDMQLWSNISNVFLGNIIVKNKKQQSYQICVFLECKNNFKKKFITIINPKNNLIRVSSNNIIHTVYFDEKEEISFDNRDEIKVKGIGLFDEICNYCTYNDVSDVYNESDLFCQEPRNIKLDINPHLTASKNSVQKELNTKVHYLAKEYHYYDCFSQKFINFISGFSSDSCFKINEITCFKNNKYSLLVVHKPNSIEKNNEIICQSKENEWDSYFFSENKSSLINPSLHQTLDLNDDCEKLYIEIPSPSVYFPGTNYSYWHIDKSKINKTLIRIRELSVKHFNSIIVQRFVVDIMKRKYSNFNFIDHLKFCVRSFDQKEKLENQGVISISLWKKDCVKEKENSKHYIEVEMIQYNVSSFSESCNVISMNSLSSDFSCNLPNSKINYGYYVKK